MSRFDKPEICPSCGVELPAKKLNLSGEITRVVRNRPDLTLRQIADLFRISLRTVKRYSKRAGITRPHSGGRRLSVDKSFEAEGLATK